MNRQSFPAHCAPTNIVAQIEAAGPPGKSAWQYAVEGGYSGSEAQFYRDLASLGSGIAGQLYTKPFTAGDFVPSGARFMMTIPASEHGLGIQSTVKEVFREQDNLLGNVCYQYDLLPNGTIVLYADEAFNGKLAIEKI